MALQRNLTVRSSLRPTAPFESFPTVSSCIQKIINIFVRDLTSDGDEYQHDVIQATTPRGPMDGCHIRSRNMAMYVYI